MQEQPSFVPEQSDEDRPNFLHEPKPSVSESEPTPELIPLDDTTAFSQDRSFNECVVQTAALLDRHKALSVVESMREDEIDNEARRLIRQLFSLGKDANGQFLPAVQEQLQQPAAEGPADPQSAILPWEITETILEQLKFENYISMVQKDPKGMPEFRLTGKGIVPKPKK